MNDKLVKASIGAYAALFRRAREQQKPSGSVILTKELVALQDALSESFGSYGDFTKAAIKEVATQDKHSQSITKISEAHEKAVCEHAQNVMDSGLSA